MTRIAAIGFDLGETLLTYADTPLNWSALYEPALQHVAKTCAIAVTSAELGSACRVLRRYNTRLHPRTVEHPAEAIFAEVFATWTSLPSADRHDAITAFFRFFQQRVVPYSDTLRALASLRQLRIPLGALTDTPYGMPREFVRRDLAETSIEPLLDVWLTSVDVGSRKPHTAGFQKLAVALNVPLAELCYVGNEEKDIVGAREAGALAVLIAREGLAPSWGQHRTIQSLDELVSLIG